MSTIKDIAALAGVSRGTVDRVLNNRGAVNPETAQRIRSIAEAVNYSPSVAGKTLAVKKKQLRFGYILFSSTSSNPFFTDVVRGIKNRANEMKEFGVKVDIRYAAIDNPALQVALMDELVESGIHGLAITPINTKRVRDKIRALTERGIPVVTVNSDIADCGRIAYVGSNYYRSGQTAAGLMNMICAGKAKVGIVLGSPWVLCHSERVAAFTEQAATEYPGIEIIDTVVNNDDDIESYAVVFDLLERHPEINALFLAAAGVQGACRAVDALGLRGKVKVLCYDATAPTRKLVEERAIVAAISQQPTTQGTKPLDILMDYLGLGVKPERDCFYTKIEIKIKENL